MKKFAGTLRNHEDLLMNYFKAGKLYSSGIVEGLNLRIDLCMRKAHGYRSFDLLQSSLYHALGDLPEPKFSTDFAEEPITYHQHNSNNKPIKEPSSNCPHFRVDINYTA